MHRERDEDFIRHDCKDRISKLEGLLEASAREKDELRTMVLELTKEVAALTVKVEYLSTENAKLRKTA
jgi:predicted nuclease with TOPRIM domain